MPRPNDDFLNQFGYTDPAVRRYLPGKKDIIKSYIELKNKDTTKLNESVSNKVNSLFERAIKKPLFENKIDSLNKNWKLVNTPQGIFYFNVVTNQWMNNFGLIGDSLADLIDDVNDISGTSRRLSQSIDDPLPPIATSAADYEVWATTFESIPSWNTLDGFGQPAYTTISIVPTIFIDGSVYNGYRAYNDTTLSGWNTAKRNEFIDLALTIPETRRVALMYYFFDELVPYTENKRVTYAATTDGITYGDRRFLTPWLNDSFTLYKSLFTSVLEYLDANNITIPYFNDDKESVSPTIDLIGYVSNYYGSGGNRFDIEGNPIIPWTNYNYSPPGGTYYADARTPAAIMSDSRFVTFVNPLTNQTFAESVVDLYKELSNNSGYTGTAFDLYSLAAGITHPGDFTCYFCFSEKEFSFFGPGSSLTEAQRQDNLLKMYAWASTTRELVQGYYATRAHHEAFAEVPRFNNSMYSNYEDFAINVIESEYYQDSNNQRLLKRDYENLSGGMVFYGQSGNILGNNYNTATNFRVGYVKNPQTDQERYNLQGYNNPAYTPSIGSTFVRYATNNGLGTDLGQWEAKISHLQFVLDMKHIRLAYRSKPDYWLYHTPWLWLAAAYNTNAYSQRYHTELIYHLACHGVLYFIRYANGIDNEFSRVIMHEALNEWRNISFNSKARPCSNATGDINSLVERIVLEDAFDNLLISGGQLLVTGKYLWRLTVPPSAVRENNTVVLQRVGSDTDIPETITINVPYDRYDYTNIKNGIGTWIKRIVNTPPNYVVIPP